MLLAFLFCFAVLTSEAQMAPPKSDAIYRNFHGPGQDFFVFGYNPNDHEIAVSILLICVGYEIIGIFLRMIGKKP